MRLISHLFLQVSGSAICLATIRSFVYDVINTVNITRKRASMSILTSINAFYLVSEKPICLRYFYTSKYDENFKGPTWRVLK